MSSQEPSTTDHSQILEIAQQHVLNTKVAADDTITRCVDGGYQLHDPEARGGIAFPGADLGTAMALLAAGKSPQAAFQAVYDFKRFNDQKFYWHTDQHEGQAGCAVGCGHCNAAINQDNDQFYGATPADVQRLLDIVRRNQADSPEHMVCVQLNREHAELGILVINSSEHDVMPQTESGQQFFVYSQTRHQNYLTDFLDFMNADEALAEQLPQIVSHQTSATLALLGSSRGKPMIAVEPGSPMKIKLIGHAPDQPSSLADSIE